MMWHADSLTHGWVCTYDTWTEMTGNTYTDTVMCGICCEPCQLVGRQFLIKTAWLKRRNYVFFQFLFCFRSFFQSDGYFTHLCFVPRVAADIQTSKHLFRHVNGTKKSNDWIICLDVHVSFVASELDASICHIFADQKLNRMYAEIPPNLLLSSLRRSRIYDLLCSCGKF